ncbi:hypothetical protein U9K47_27425 [Bacillus toyonensis]|uniref:hypothetical protein n=1 Tax=Bacillus toyonensis TaxID=155322 RepID=UPI003466EE07
MPENISISGQVQGYNREPIFNIKVLVFQDKNYVSHTFTDNDGKYQLSIPSNNLISVCFNTHATFANAKEWHPSVVSNIDTRQDVIINRFLMRVGASNGAMAEIDALTAYQFCAMWTNKDTNLERGYAEYTAFRLSQMKQPLRELDEFRGKLEEFFLKISKSS